MPVISTPLIPSDQPATPATSTPPGAGSGSNADPVEAPDSAAIPQPSATPGDSGSGFGGGSGSSPGTGGTPGAGNSGEGEGEGQGDTGEAPGAGTGEGEEPGDDGGNPEGGTQGRESGWWWGKGEPGQVNADRGIVQNWWQRIERDANDDVEELYGDRYGRLDFRFNGVDSVLFCRRGKAEDNGTAVQTLIDFDNGYFQQWHQDAVNATEKKAYWYLATNSDKRFISIDGRDASAWIYNEDKDYQFFFLKGRMVSANLDYSHYCVLDSTDATLWIYNELRQYAMKDGAIWTSNNGYTRWASISSADGSLYIFNEALNYVMREGRISASTADHTRYASISGAEGSGWIYNENRQYIFKDGRIISSNADYTNYCSLDSSNGSLWIYNKYNRVYLAKDGRLLTANANYTRYVTLDSNDGSIWAYDENLNNFKYKGGKLEVYYQDSPQNYALIQVDGDEASYWFYDALGYTNKYKNQKWQLYSSGDNTYLDAALFSGGGGSFKVSQGTSYFAELKASDIECYIMVVDGQTGLKYTSSNQLLQLYDETASSYIEVDNENNQITLRKSGKLAQITCQDSEISIVLQGGSTGLLYSYADDKFRVFNATSSVELDLSKLNGRSMEIRSIDVCENGEAKHMDVLATQTY